MCGKTHQWIFCHLGCLPLFVGLQQILIFTRPGVAGAVLQTPSKLINLAGCLFPPNLQPIINPKPIELGSWNFERMFTSNYVSQVRCQVSGVTCCVICFQFEQLHMILKEESLNSLPGITQLGPRHSRHPNSN